MKRRQVQALHKALLLLVDGCPEQLHVQEAQVPVEARPLELKWGRKTVCVHGVGCSCGLFKGAAITTQAQRHRGTDTDTQTHTETDLAGSGEVTRLLKGKLNGGRLVQHQRTLSRERCCKVSRACMKERNAALEG